MPPEAPMKKAMKPKAYHEAMLVQPTGGDLVVYDRRNHHAHCLDPFAAFVWQHADGNRSAEELMSLWQEKSDPDADKEAPKDIHWVWEALFQLEEAGLLASPLSVDPFPVSRRRLLLAMGSLPLVTSILSPTPAMAASEPGIAPPPPTGDTTPPPIISPPPPTGDTTPPPIISPPGSTPNDNDSPSHGLPPGLIALAPLLGLFGGGASAGGAVEAVAPIIAGAPPSSPPSPVTLPTLGTVPPPTPQMVAEVPFPEAGLSLPTEKPEITKPLKVTQKHKLVKKPQGPKAGMGAPMRRSTGPLPNTGGSPGLYYGLGGMMVALGYLLHYSSEDERRHRDLQGQIEARMVTKATLKWRTLLFFRSFSNFRRPS